MSKTLREEIFKLSVEKKNWNIACKEWDCIYYTEDSVPKCICGVNIKYNFEIKNSCNGNICIVGCVCINQFNNELLNDYVKTFKNKTFVCETCDKKCKKEPFTVKTECDTCKNSCEIYCEVCDEPFMVLKTQSSWRTKCKKCFINYKNNYIRQLKDCNKCIDCGISFEITPETKWKVKCIYCWRKSRNLPIHRIT